jgi:hypothetical protein
MIRAQFAHRVCHGMGVCKAVDVCHGVDVCFFFGRSEPCAKLFDWALDDAILMRPLTIPTTRSHGDREVVPSGSVPMLSVTCKSIVAASLWNAMGGVESAEYRFLWC